MVSELKQTAQERLTQRVEVADNTYRDGSSELNNTEASFVQDGGVSVDQRKMNAGRSRPRSFAALAELTCRQSERTLNGCPFGWCSHVLRRKCIN